MSGVVQSASSSVRPLTSWAEGRSCNIKLSSQLSSLHFFFAVTQSVVTAAAKAEAGKEAPSSQFLSHFASSTFPSLSGLDRPSVRKWVRESASRARKDSLSLSLFYQKRSSSTEGESKLRSSCNTSPLSSSTHALFSSFLFFLVFFWFSVLLLLSFPSVCCEASLRESVCVCFCCCYQISSSACASRILVRKCSRIFCVDGRTGLV